MADATGFPQTPLFRQSFVLHADGLHGPLVLQDLASLHRTRLESLALVQGQLERWLRQEPNPNRRESKETTGGTPSLTNSQARVAQLAADGLTNVQIGVVLGVRLRTVESHLTATYRKLGVRSRRELAQVLPLET